MPIVVIGDGRTNFVSLAQLCPYISGPIIAVNLPEINKLETMMFDKLNIDYVHINSPSSSELFELPTDKSRVVFCDANCLQCISIRQECLYVNLQSFQEMTLETIDAYFKLFRKSGGYLYQSNRLKKTLISGQSSSFSHYPYLDTDFKLIERIDPKMKFILRPVFPFIRRIPTMIESLHKLQPLNTQSRN